MNGRVSRPGVPKNYNLEATLARRPKADREILSECTFCTECKNVRDVQRAEPPLNRRVAVLCRQAVKAGAAPASKYEGQRVNFPHVIYSPCLIPEHRSSVRD
jgi:hypothetical protein